MTTMKIDKENSNTPFGVGIPNDSFFTEKGLPPHKPASARVNWKSLYLEKSKEMTRDSRLVTWPETDSLTGESVSGSFDNLNVSDNRYTCYICKKTYSRVSSLEKHFRIHSTLPKFECPETGCLKTCTEKGNLLKHLTWIHKLPNTHHKYREYKESLDKQEKRERKCVIDEFKYQGCQSSWKGWQMLGSRQRSPSQQNRHQNHVITMSDNHKAWTEAPKCLPLPDFTKGR